VFEGMGWSGAGGTTELFLDFFSSAYPDNGPVGNFAIKFVSTLSGQASDGEITGEALTVNGVISQIITFNNRPVAESQPFSWKVNVSEANTPLGSAYMFEIVVRYMRPAGQGGELVQAVGLGALELTTPMILDSVRLSTNREARYLGTNAALKGDW